MLDFASMLRQAADTLDSINDRVKEQRADEQAPMVDTEAVTAAVVTLSATAISAVLDLVDTLPRPANFTRGHDAQTSEAGSVAEEVDKVVGRLGLVQEDELAALRKRVVDLEAALSKGEKPAPKAKS
jgi:hypothetical protein